MAHGVYAMHTAMMAIDTQDSAHSKLHKLGLVLLDFRLKLRREVAL